MKRKEAGRDHCILVTPTFTPGVLSTEACLRMSHILHEVEIKGRFSILLHDSITQGSAHRSTGNQI